VPAALVRCDELVRGAAPGVPGADLMQRAVLRTRPASIPARRQDRAREQGAAHVPPPPARHPPRDTRRRKTCSMRKCARRFTLPGGADTPHRAEGSTKRRCGCAAAGSAAGAPRRRGRSTPSTTCSRPSTSNGRCASCRAGSTSRECPGASRGCSPRAAPTSSPARSRRTCPRPTSPSRETRTCPTTSRTLSCAGSRRPRRRRYPPC